MKKLYSFQTSIGVFYICEHYGRFHPVFNEESLGSYVSAMQAIDDLAGGHTFSISNGHDTAELGIPEVVSEWTRLV